MTPAFAQACCAGSSAITPGRLGLHEDALVGLQVRGANLIGSYDAAGRYRTSAVGNSEQNFEQDVVAALRLLGRGQVAALIPLVETRRAVPGHSEFGGGLGDINLSVRYDLLSARRSSIFPGLALLLGATLPTGVPVEEASSVLATDATGVGALQTNGAVSLEQIFGAWTVSVAGLVAQRWAREVQDVEAELGAQWTLVAAGSYTLESEVAVAVSAGYTVEGDATIDGRVQPDSSRRLLTTTVSAVLPLSDSCRLQGSSFLNPPLSSLGANQSALAGLSFMVIYAWF